MGTWTKLDNTQVPPLTDNINIPATAGTYYSDPYYIGLLKNGEHNTINISDLTITDKPDWVKDASFNNKSQNGDQYHCLLTYEVDENTETSPRSGIIRFKHGPANKTLTYSITQSANKPTEPTPTVYDFTAKYHVQNQGDGDKYSLKVNNHSVGSESGPFESINAGDQSNSEQLDINITMSNKTLQQDDSDLKFMFEISCNDLESFDAVIYNDDVGGKKTVYIQHSQSNIGELKIESIRPGLVISITIFRGGQMSIIEQPQLSEGITGTITINSDIIPFIVTFGFS